MPKINAEGNVSDATLDPDPAFEEAQPVDEPVDDAEHEKDPEPSKPAPKRTARK